MSNYPIGYSGEEGRDEETFIFYLNGEIELENYSEEEADDVFYNSSVRKLLQRGLTLDESTINECTEELIDMTMREALQRGLYLD